MSHIGHDFNDLSRPHTVLMKNNTILSSVLFSDRAKAKIIEETILTAHNLSDSAEMCLEVRVAEECLHFVKGVVELCTSPLRSINRNVVKITFYYNFLMVRCYIKPGLHNTCKDFKMSN